MASRQPYRSIIVLVALAVLALGATSVVAQAGRLGAVTLATNMAGRGTDIVLGGNAEMMLKARGLENIFKQNIDKAAKLYNAIDSTDFAARWRTPKWMPSQAM